MVKKHRENVSNFSWGYLASWLEEWPSRQVQKVNQVVKGILSRGNCTGKFVEGA
jgi:hypothetical protein